ncbi:hypothetical protein O1611_g3378 [Lasiodiplodia mahajangana]|uniref:Uncharacterized protein n=1 Tax=Lasiodiplodia mahajangana TaxID=1108764 RepID=A0ACC2JRY3_9PEZI|nr:hypothetical protein O1611_g3378 [Lasiodiplodia mahajangana]
MRSILRALRSEPEYEYSTTSPSDDAIEDSGLPDSQGAETNDAYYTLRRQALRGFAVLVILYVSTIIYFAWRTSVLESKLRRSSLYSPANEALEWKLSHWPHGDGLSEPYVGYPRPELEEAWEGLLGNMNIRISKQDVQHFGREKAAVALPDGSGYIGTLNVYHEIHCIRWLHKYLYQEVYWPEIDDTGRQKNLVHSEHCLSTLRKFALCHGDVGLITYSWSPHHKKPAANATAHQCIDWDALANWAAERAIDMFKPGLLVHPTLGPAYPHGKTFDDIEHEEHTLPNIPP